MRLIIVFIFAVVALFADDFNQAVEDYNKGAYTAQETISQWRNVCEAEDQWIAPFQETADVMFNSALNIEFAVLRPHAELILAAVPRNCPEYAEAHRLLKFLHYFRVFSDKDE